MDVIGSGIEASPWGMGSYGFESYVAASPGNIVAALSRYWADYAGAILAAEAELGDSCLPIRYEDLVSDPEEQAARLFEFAGVAPAPGITRQCFTFDRQRYGPGDYKIWSTTEVTDSSVGRGWRVPARMIPAELLGVINDLADQLGYVQVGEDWGVGSPPADLRVPLEASSEKRVMSFGAVLGDAVLGDAVPVSTVLADRVQDSVRRLGAEFARVWEPSATESVLLYATAAELDGATAWWRLDLAAGTVTAGTDTSGTVTAGAGARAVDTDWSVTASASAWQRVLSGELNLSVAFRTGDLRYADKGDHGAGSPGANNRIAMLAELLGITRWRPTT